MCGITGVFTFNKDLKWAEELRKATASLHKRGPDAENLYLEKRIGLGHRRLSIIDTSVAGSQPFSDASGRFTIVFNGEFFDFQKYRAQLEQEGFKFSSHSDTEVLLQLYIQKGASCLNLINGFFAFAIYDKLENKLFIARDRYGIKPLYYYSAENVFVFGSEMRSLLQFPFPKDLDKNALFAFLQLNYIPGPLSSVNTIKTLAPGCFMELSADGQIKQESYYDIKTAPAPIVKGKTYSTACLELLEEAVQRRLVSDVPLGAFLSGGVDSSAIVALASRHVKDLKTFSIGFSDNRYYDESRYAEQVAKLFHTDHTTFLIKEADMLEALPAFLAHIDEPFADSSALALYILSQHTAKHVKVALSGDGADELFGGYNKHRAEWQIRNRPIYSKGISLLAGISNLLPASRKGFIANKARQLQRFAWAASLSAKERYWRLCGFCSEEEAAALLSEQPALKDYYKIKSQYLASVTGEKDLNDILFADLSLVLQNDMLVKVDRMSMANSIEVRSPFLDYKLVDYVTKLSSSLKIDASGGKILLKKALADILPAEILYRSKHGFEVPLLNWLRKDLQPLMGELFNEEFLIHQGIFKAKEIRMLQERLYSYQPGDSPSRLWGLIVFQSWWKNHMQ